MSIEKALEYAKFYTPKVGPGQFTYERFAYWLVDQHPDVAAEALAEALRKEVKMCNIFAFWKQRADLDVDSCEWKEVCDCESKTKAVTCECCTSYRQIDSATGFCRASPELITVAWCRDTCDLFKELSALGKK